MFVFDWCWNWTSRRRIVFALPNSCAFVVLIHICLSFVNFCYIFVQLPVLVYKTRVHFCSISVYILFKLVYILVWDLAYILMYTLVYTLVYISGDNPCTKILQICTQILPAVYRYVHFSCTQMLKICTFFHDLMYICCNKKMGGIIGVLVPLLLRTTPELPEIMYIRGFPDRIG